ncbi:MAG: hypothetical protein ABI333_14840 [bacterium]
MLVGLASAAISTPSRADTTELRAVRPTLTGKEVIRDGFHFQVLFGWGGGPDSLGVFHAMEIGGTLGNGVTLALIHTFIQNKGIAGQHGGPDLFGGWMPEIKFPLFFDDLIVKIAIGPGGIHDQSNGIRAIPGLAWLYGIDYHLPFFRRSGMTLSAQMLHAWVRKHHFGFAIALGYTFF